MGLSGGLATNGTEGGGGGQVPASVIRASAFLSPSGGDDSAQVNAAITTNCEVVLGPGTFLLNAANIGLPRNATAVTVRGSGRGVTTIQLSATAPRAFDLVKVADYDVYQNITIEDLTVDCNNVNGALGDHVILGYGATGTLRFSAKNIRVRRVDAINIPTDPTLTTSNRRAFKLYPVLNSGDSAVSITNVVVEFCRAYGGNTGFIVQGFYPTSGSPITIDDVHFRYLYHDTLITPTQFFGSNNFEIGGNASCGLVTLDHCWGRGCGDAGVEVDGTDLALVTNCVIEDAWNSAYLATNFNVPPNPNAQKFVFDNCHARRTRITHGGGFLAVGNNSVALGRVKLRGCSWYKTGTDTNGMFGQNVADGILVQNLSLQGLSVDDFDYYSEGANWNDPVTGSFSAGIHMNGLQGSPDIRLRGIRARYLGTQSGAATLTWQLCRIATTSGAADLDVSDVNAAMSISGGTALSLSLFGLGWSSGQNLALSSARFDGIAVHSSSGDTQASGLLIGASVGSPSLTLSSQITVENFDCAQLPSTGHPFRFGDAINQAKVNVLNSSFPSGPYSSSQFIAPSNYKLHILADDPVSYWRFDEQAGAATAADIATGGNPGTYFSSPAFGATGLISGDIDTAVQFANASSQYATLPGPALTTDGAIEFWFKWTGGDAGNALIRDATSANGYILGFDNAGTFAIRANGTTINTSKATTAVQDGNAHHLLASFTAGILTCYIDGVQVARATYATTVAPVMPWYVARNGTVGQYAAATIDEIAMYPYALTKAQAVAHYNLGAAAAVAVPVVTPTGAPPSAYRLAVYADQPTSLWLLNDSLGTSAVDSGGAGNTGTYVNSPTFGQPSLIAGEPSTTSTSFVSASNQKVTLPNPALGSTGSIEFWFNWTANSPLLRDNTAASGYIVGFDSAGTFAFRVNGTTINTSLATTAVRDGNKHHLVLTVSGTTATLYIDGISVGTGAYTAATSALPWHVSENGTAAQYADATFAWIAMYATALTAVRVLAHYNLGK